MRTSRVVVLLSIVLLVSGCACRTKRVGPGNVPTAEDGGPLKDVHFAFDQAALDASAKATLDSNAQWLLENQDAKVRVEGHCDERGSNEYNMALGWKRARAAQDYLQGKGVAAARMSTESYGEELPVDPRHTEEAWKRNRRSHFSVQN